MGNFEVYGDQKTLTQWDVGRKVAVAQKCDYIHFANAAMSEAVACKVREDDGLWIAEIPDEVLQVSGVLRVYAFVVTAGENYTKYSQNLFIRARPKPDNYLYTPTTGVSWEALVERVGELEEKTAQKPVYTAEEVGARPDTWMPTAAEIGAAPAGYGLGENSVTPEDLNTHLKNGYFRTTTTVANSNFPHGAGHIRTYNASEAVQNIVSTTSGKEIVRYTTDGGATWIVEHVNPTMEVGVEYRTTKRHNGKVVYTAYLEWDALPVETASTGVTLPNNATATAYVSVDAYIKNSSNTSKLPLFNWTSGTVEANLRATANTIYIRNYRDLSAYSAYVTVEYTKD